MDRGGCLDADDCWPAVFPRAARGIGLYPNTRKSLLAGLVGSEALESALRPLLLLAGDQVVIETGR